MKNILFLITLFITVVLSACFDDKGNYDYHEINELHITGLPEELQVKYRNVDTLRATPVIEATADDGSMPDRYSFKWEAVSELKAGETQTTSYLIGEEENLSYFVELPDGEYNVNCLVKDTITRVTWKGTFKLRVTTQLNEGWLVLSDVNGNARLDLISMSAKEDMVVRDILQDAPELKGPKRINSVYQMYYNQWGTDLRFYIVTETATAALDVATYQWDEANEIRYEMLEYPVDFSATNRTAGMGWELLVSDKYVFGGTTFGQEVLFGVPINYLAGDNGNYFNVAPAVGVAQRALDLAIDYSRTRLSFGQPIGKLEGIQFKLADMEAKIQACQAQLAYSAALVDKGIYDTLNGSSTKLFVSEAVLDITLQAQQVYGGYGYSKEYPLEKLVRDARIFSIYEGSSEIQRYIIGKTLVGKI